MVTYDYSDASKEARVHSNLGNWHIQRNKLFEFIHNLINESLKYSDVLDRTQSWNKAQTINFLPFYVHERVNLAWRRSVKNKTSGRKRGK